MMNRREFLTRAAGGAAALLAPGLLRGAERPPAGRPNVLLITVDDMNWDTPGCFGGAVKGVTPNIDRLAGEGMRSMRAHMTIALCQPCRSALMTGRYPHRNGAMGFEPIRNNVPTLGEQLHRAGYLNGVMSKGLHMTPVKQFGWDVFVSRNKLGHGRHPKLYYEQAKAFFDRAKREGRPFFLNTNSSDPHRPFHDTADEGRRFKDYKDDYPDPSRVYRHDEVTVPGFLPDLPWIRQDVATYYCSARRADETVGEVLRALKESGLEESTLVMFLSDHGMPFPFAKRSCYLNGTRTPWIVRWPGKVKPGSADKRHFISGIDFMPTVLAAAGLEKPKGMDGTSFLPLLAGKGQEGRERVFTVLHKTVTDQPLPIRCVHEGSFSYIYNAWADGKTPFRTARQLGGPIRVMMNAAKTDPKIAARVKHFMYRTSEELYDYSTDPDALSNLAGRAGHGQRLAHLRGQMLAWMKRTKDPIAKRFQRHLQTVSSASRSDK